MNLETLASTHDTFSGTIDKCIQKETELHNNFLASAPSNYSYPTLCQPKFIDRYPFDKSNVVSNAWWFEDGSGFVSLSQDLAVRSYLLSPTLLNDNEEQLIPFTRSFQNFPVICADLHPHSSFNNGFAALMTSSSDSPLRLQNLIPNEEGKSNLLSTFNTRDRLVERFDKVHSLKFINDVNFIAGSNRKVSLFDLNRSDPLSEIRVNGIISSIATSKSEFSQQSTFYTASFSSKIHSHDVEGNITGSSSITTGNGITQIIESDNGRYLYVISRNSSSISILDLRMGLELVAELSTTKSKNQRLVGDVFKNSQGLIIGTAKGEINWFKDSELGLSSEPEIFNIADDPVCLTKVNPVEQSVVLTALGDIDSLVPKLQISKIL